MKSRQKRKQVWTDEEDVEPETPPLKMRQCKRSSDNVRATAALLFQHRCSRSRLVVVKVTSPVQVCVLLDHTLYVGR